MNALRAMLAVAVLLAGVYPEATCSRLQVERVAAAGPGMLLVARRGLPDPNFSESVVLMVRHGAEGSLGVIINRPLGATLDAALPDLPVDQTAPHALHWGGPVMPDHLSYLGRGDPVPDTALFVVDGLFFGGRLAAFRALLGEGDARGRLRVYAGHAGWAPGQLQAEIERDDWHLVALTEDMVFDLTPEALWPVLIDRLDPQGLVQRARPSRAGRQGP